MDGTYKSPMKRKEHDLNQSSMIMFQPLIFRGVGQYLFVGEVVFLHSLRTFRWRF